MQIPFKTSLICSLKGELLFDYFLGFPLHVETLITRFFDLHMKWFGRKSCRGKGRLDKGSPSVTQHAVSVEYSCLLLHSIETLFMFLLR